MPNGKFGDSLLSDLTIHGAHPFPSDIEELLLRIHTLGRAMGRWPLGENWPYYPRECDWAQGRNLQEARELLSGLISLLETSRGDEVLINPLTNRPFAAK
jgi:hypothetical protein